MAIYSTNPSSVNESVILDMSNITESAHDPGVKGAFAVIAEAELNYSNLMKAVGITELTSVEENGLLEGEVLYEANMLTGFLGKLKDFFMNLWEKIKGLFKKFIGMIDMNIQNDKEFVKKYRDHLLKVDTRDFEYNGFKYDSAALEGKYALRSVIDRASKVHQAEGFGVLTANTVGTQLIADPTRFAQESSITAPNEKLSSNRTELIDKMRAAAAGETGTMSANEMSEHIYKALRSGEDKPETINSVNVSELLEIISNFKEAKKVSEKDMKDIDKEFNEIIKGLQKLEKDLSKTVPGDGTAAVNTAKNHAVKYINNTYGLVKEVQLITQAVNGMKLSALKERNRQAKAVCVKLINYRPKNEQTGFDEGSALSSVKFV